MRLISDLLSRRRQLMDMQTMEKNRSQIMPKAVSSLIKPILTALKNQIEKVDGKLQKLITITKLKMTSFKVFQGLEMSLHLIY